jgi:hypothetical protein
MSAKVCRNCGLDIEYQRGVGWVLTEIGGTYDYCEFSPQADFEDKRHSPSKITLASGEVIEANS